MTSAWVRLWLPIFLLVFTIVNLELVAEYWLETRARETDQAMVLETVDALGARLEVLLGQQIYTSKAVASHVAFSPDLTQEEFAAYVESFIPSDSGVSLVAAARAPDLTLTRIYPLAGNEAGLGRSIRKHLKKEQAMHAGGGHKKPGDIVFAGPIKLMQGDVGFVARAPAFFAQRNPQGERVLWGLIAAFIPAKTLYREAGLTADSLGIDLALRKPATGQQTGKVFFGQSDLFESEANALIRPIKFGRDTWEIAAVPKTGWGGENLSALWFIRGVACFIGLLSCLGVIYRYRLHLKQQFAEQNFQGLFEASSDAIFIHDADTLNFIDVNRATEIHLGYSKAELLGQNLGLICSPECPVDTEAVSKTLEKDGKIVFETEHKRKDGALVEVEISAKQVQRADGAVVISAARDISERKKAEAALLRSQQDLINAIESINEGFALWGADGRLRLFNQRYIELSPYMKEIIKVGVSFESVLGYVFDQGLVTTDVGRDEWIAMRVRDHEAPTGPYELRAADGRYIKISEYSTPDGGCVGIYEDITELKRATEHIHYRAYFDVLTGLPNRENFLGKLSETLSVVKRTQQICALLFIDLDRFKHINDTLGHAIGDKLLREVALRLRTAVRETDFVARFAGDEFVVLLRYIEAPINGMRIAQNLLTKLGAPYELDGKEVYCSASIGIALAPNDTVEAETYLKYADLAMYQVKTGGGNAYRFFTNNMTKSTERFVAIEKDLWQSIKEQQCLLNYQPVFDLQQNTLTSVEALVRWQHPEFGLLQPDEFIPIAEETAFIDELGRWVIGDATATTINWHSQDRNKPLNVAVNVSSRQFWGQFDVQFVRDTIAAAGFPTDRLIVEITESLVLGEEQRIVKVLEELRAIGVGISIDDFGTGYSAISYLKRLPVTALKIDKSFIKDIERSLDDALLVESIIAMAKALRVKVCAEGIETESQRKMLRDMGCDFGQGMWFGEPLSAEEFRHRFLASNVVALRDRMTD